MTIVDGAARHTETWSPEAFDVWGWEVTADLLGQRVRELRRDRDMTQSALATEAGLHRNHVSNVERGTNSRSSRASDPRLSTICRIAHALDVDVVDLLTDRGAGPTKNRTKSRGTSRRR